MDWYELDGISPDAQAELDLLSATFPELTFDTKENVAIISVPAREGSDGAARAVTADLSLHLPADYPSAACVVSVLRSRGGIQDTELQKQLQEIADGAALGEEPCLYQLIEDARDEMGKAVSARKDCEICLDTIAATDMFVAVQCLHVFHERCFARWVHAYDERQAAATTNVQAREQAHGMIRAAEEDLRSATMQHDAALSAMDAVLAEMETVAGLQVSLRGGPQQAAAYLQQAAATAADTGSGDAAAAGGSCVSDAAAAALLPCIRPALDHADAAASSKLKRGQPLPPFQSSLQPVQQLTAAATLLASVPDLVQGVVAATKSRLANCKTRQKTAQRAVERSTAKHSTATTALAETIASQAGKGERTKDTPCPVCRATVPYDSIEAWAAPLLAEEGGGSAAAAADSRAPLEPYEGLDATTVAYIHRMQQQVVRGLQRQLGRGGVLPEALAEAEAVLEQLQQVLGGT